ncbi:ABC transporter related protein [Rhodomicrobium vannielii ATCC 17100]|uniref:ABC transporter related protein n=1 Tax=Rhodomicrobium vannielii (strain ATCC 17100 / DSM 162 / LMG 4299 / NCIMB 10020 / ATH 3.1.1) TaxID=648757 RepID=E3I4W2_RHOVT|nr:ABC transporter ATP-binding protein [Rhodomicrobium vannielii]ADP72784.1 ABC transporter related protein [Rhodomicrobium vannielii ATCC 17100]
MEKILISGVRKVFRIKAGGDAARGDEPGELTALDGVDLSVRAGEFVTLVGPSGSGKSVLLDIVGGLASASSGRVSIDGVEVHEPARNSAYVFQQYALFPWRSAIGNVEYPLEVRGVGKAERREKARQLLALFGLSGFAERYPNQLSGGMQQRVAIARALASDPEVLLMDEPFAALDAQTREILQGELLRIWEEIRTTVLFVTHGIDEAVFLADRVVVMTARPGVVKKIIDVELPRPRLDHIRSSAEFNACRREVWEALSDEVKKAQRDQEYVLETESAS